MSKREQQARIDESFGQIAYEAYTKELQAAPDSFTRQWGQLSERERQAWAHAAGSAIDAFAAAVMV